MPFCLNCLLLWYAYSWMPGLCPSSFTFRPLKYPVTSHWKRQVDLPFILQVHNNIFFFFCWPWNWYFSDMSCRIWALLLIANKTSPCLPLHVSYTPLELPISSNNYLFYCYWDSSLIAQFLLLWSPTAPIHNMSVRDGENNNVVAGGLNGGGGYINFLHMLPPGKTLCMWAHVASCTLSRPIVNRDKHCRKFRHTKLESIKMGEGKINKVCRMVWQLCLFSVHCAVMCYVWQLGEVFQLVRPEWIDNTNSWTANAKSTFVMG